MRVAKEGFRHREQGLGTDTVEQTDLRNQWEVKLGPLPDPDPGVLPGPSVESRLLCLPVDRGPLGPTSGTPLHPGVHQNKTKFFSILVSEVVVESPQVLSGFQLTLESVVTTRREG